MVNECQKTSKIWLSTPTSAIDTTKIDMVSDVVIVVETMLPKKRVK